MLQYQTKTAENFRNLKMRLRKRNEKDRERRAQRLLQKKMSQDEDGVVQDLAILKRNTRANSRIGTN